MTRRPFRRSRRLAVDAAGLALMEFALVLPLLLLMLALIVDIGICFNARLKLMRGVMAGAHYAHENGGDVTAATADAFRSTVAGIVTDTADSNAAPVVTVSINTGTGSTIATGFYCITGYPVQWRTTIARGTDCGDSTTSAKFVTIVVEGTVSSIIPVVSVGTRLFPLRETILVRAK